MFTDFVLEITYPPNPVRQLNNELTEGQQTAHDMYFNRVSVQLFTCNGCRFFNPKGNMEHGVKRPGFFGADGSYSFEFEPQIMKIPHFRNLYQKVGMFGMEPISKLLTDNDDNTNNFYGDQIRGFGFQHDGSVDTIERFISSTLFRFVAPDPNGSPGNPGGFSNDPVLGMAERRNMESFLLAADSNIAPIVGQQITLNSHNVDGTKDRLRLLESRAAVSECDLVANVSISEYFVYLDGQYLSESGDNFTSDSLLQAVEESDTPITFTCLPPGSASLYFTGIAEAFASQAD